MIDWLEINDQNGFMYAEGTFFSDPNEQEVKQAVNNRGYVAYNISISHDGLQQSWRFTAKIKKG